MLLSFASSRSTEMWNLILFKLASHADKILSVIICLAFVCLRNVSICFYCNTSKAIDLNLWLIWILFMFAGLFVGALIRYAASKTTTTHLTVFPNNTLPTYNNTLPPDTLWLNVIQYVSLYQFRNIIKHSFVSSAAEA